MFLCACNVRLHLILWIKYRATLSLCSNILTFAAASGVKILCSLLIFFTEGAAVLLPRLPLNIGLEKRMLLLTFWLGRASHHLRNLDEHSRGEANEPFLIDCDPPYGLLFKEKATIQGKHQAGKTVLCLTEKLDPDYLLLAKCAAWREGRYKQTLAEIALASQNCTVAYEVEYVAAAEDGEGRLYAQQTSAQSMPKDLRLLLFGDTHWEVDISGAHYELIRIGSNSQTLPCIRMLREWLFESFSSMDENGGQAEVQRNVKCFPILVINAGKQHAISVMQSKGYSISGWVFHWADDLILATRLSYQRRASLDAA